MENAKVFKRKVSFSMVLMLSAALGQILGLFTILEPSEKSQPTSIVEPVSLSQVALWMQEPNAVQTLNLLIAMLLNGQKAQLSEPC